MKRISLVILSIFAIMIAACAPVVAPTPIISGPAPIATLATPARAASAIKTADATEIAIATETVITTETPTPAPDTQAPLPDDVDSQEALDQLAARNAACNPDTTSAQQDKALVAPRAYFLGKTVALTGYIDDVRNLDGKYDAIISLEKVDARARIYLEEALALTLNKGDHVLIEGELEIVGCVFFNDVTGELTPLE